MKISGGLLSGNKGRASIALALVLVCVGFYYWQTQGLTGQSELERHDLTFDQLPAQREDTHDTAVTMRTHDAPKQGKAGPGRSPVYHEIYARVAKLEPGQPGKCYFHSHRSGHQDE